MDLVKSLNFNKAKENDKQKVLGEGSYGCVVRPGLDCKGNKNRLKNSVNKITEINFASKNELYISKLIKQIKKGDKLIYKEHFAPVFQHCIIKFNKIINSNFDINRCENLMENMDYPFLSIYNRFVEKKFFMFYIRYIKGARTIEEYLLKNNNSRRDIGVIGHLGVPSVFIKNYLYTYCYLLDSINLLQQKNIVHNDLYDRNIIYDDKKKLPIIIDYGLSYHTRKFYKRNGKVDIKYINKLFFDFRSNHYQYNIDKRFFTFFVNNKNEYFKNEVKRSYQKNMMTKNILEYFFHDAYESLYNKKSVSYIFTEKEFKIYRESLEKYYSKFLDKTKYPTYFSIIDELLPVIYDNTDIYSLSIEYITICYNKFFKHIYDEKIRHGHVNDKNKYDTVIYLMLQIFKKVLFPDPVGRLNAKQIKNVLGFIFSYINGVGDGDGGGSDGEIYSDFISQLDKILDTNNIDKDMFYNKDYAFIDFRDFLSNKNIKYIQKLKINIKM